MKMSSYLKLDSEMYCSDILLLELFHFQVVLKLINNIGMTLSLG